MSLVSELQTAPLESDTATYTATFELGEDGWWAAQIVEVPEAISQGRTIDEARTNVADALALALDLRVKEGREIPFGQRENPRTDAASDPERIGPATAAPRSGLGPRPRPDLRL